MTTDSDPVPVLAFRGVSKVFGDHQALHPLDLEVLPGEVLVLIGGSGSGKSTLLKMVNRLVEPTTGGIRFGDDDLATLEPVALRRRIGYVQQEGGLLPHWTVRRNVELVPRLLQWPREQRRARAEELLRAVSLDPGRYAGRHPHELSGGERQRVAIARALCADPELLLLDEPFSALDAITRADARQMLRELGATLRQTVILVTHDLDEALELGDRLVILDRGHLRQVGTPDEIAEAPAHPYVERLFAGRG